jgi:ParB-like chromosome segregation protein Spo0J
MKENKIEIKVVKINEIKSNPNNPRIIKDDKFKKLVESIKGFPEMANVRPIIVNTDMIVLGGNMRLKAMREAGWKEAPIQIVNWDEQKQKEFIVKDNVGFGEWDWDDLANNWDAEELTEWGLDIPNFNTEGFSDKNKELSLDDVNDSMSIILKYTEDEYYIVKDALLKIASTPEQAIWKLLNND